MDVIPERLATRELFRAGGPRIHVNHPRHDGDTPLHDHDFVEIAVVTAGRAVHRTMTGTSQAGPGDVMVLPPGAWHAWEACRAFHLFNICFPSELRNQELAWTRADPDLGRLWAPGADGDILRFHLPADARHQLSRQIQGLRRADRHPERVGSLLLTLAGLAAHAPAAQASQLDPLISAVLDDLQGNLAHDWSLAELGRRHGRERSHLGRRFREVVGLSPLAWLARRRCERAAVLLLTTREAIATIGARVGWPDANYFARRFRTEFGQSPSAYRKQLPLPAAPAAGGDWIQW